jgi:hypothetical protein
MEGEGWGVRKSTTDARSGVLGGRESFLGARFPGRRTCFLMAGMQFRPISRKSHCTDRCADATKGATPFCGSSCVGVYVLDPD